MAKVKVLRGGLLVQDVFFVRRVVIWYFSLPVAPLRDGGMERGFNPSSRTRLAKG